MLIYVDTNIWIYAYENHPIFGDAARDVFTKLRMGRHDLAASLFLLGELQVMPTRTKNQFALASYKMLFRSRDIVMLSYQPEAVPIYVSLRADHRVKAVDALHLATAAHGRVDLFVTEDAQLRALPVPGIGRVVGLADFS